MMARRRTAENPAGHAKKVTAVVMPEDGTMRFAEDIYRPNAKLDHALAQRESSE